MGKSFWNWVERNKLAGLSDEEVRRILAPMDTDQLDKMAFGFSEGAIRTLAPGQIEIMFPGDLEAVEDEAASSGNPLAWARAVDLSEPVDVLLQGGRFKLDDGHHRWYAAKLTRRKLRARIRIDDSPVEAILARIRNG